MWTKTCEEKLKKKVGVPKTGLTTQTGAELHKRGIF